jgi:hypothetical protein
MVLVGLDVAGDPGANERHRGDARRGEGEVSGGVGSAREAATRASTRLSYRRMVQVPDEPLTAHVPDEALTVATPDEPMNAALTRDPCHGVLAGRSPCGQ